MKKPNTSAEILPPHAKEFTAEQAAQLLSALESGKDVREQVWRALSDPALEGATVAYQIQRHLQAEVARAKKRRSVGELPPLEGEHLGRADTALAKILDICGGFLMEMPRANGQPGQNDSEKKGAIKMNGFAFAIAERGVEAGWEKALKALGDALSRAQPEPARHVLKALVERTQAQAFNEENDLMRQRFGRPKWLAIWGALGERERAMAMEREMWAFYLPQTRAEIRAEGSSLCPRGYYEMSVLSRWALFDEAARPRLAALLFEPERLEPFVRALARAESFIPQEAVFSDVLARFDQWLPWSEANAKTALEICDRLRKEKEECEELRAFLEAKALIAGLGGNEKTEEAAPMAAARAVSRL